MKDIIIPLKIKKAISEDPRIIAVLLFGSAARGEHYRDIDICIVLDKKRSSKEMTEIAIYYSGRLPDKFDVSLFQQLPLYIRQRVLKDGKILISKNMPALYDIAFQTIKEFNLYEKGYLLYLEELEKKERMHAR